MRKILLPALLLVAVQAHSVERRQSGGTDATALVGTVPVASGGTGATSLSQDGVLSGNGPSAVQVSTSVKVTANQLTWGNGTSVSTAGAQGALSMARNSAITLSPAGQGLINLSTNALASGQSWLPAQLPSTAAYTNTNNNFSGTQDFSGSINARAPLTVNGSSFTVLGANAGFGTGISTSTSGLNRVVTIASNNGGELVITDTSTGGQANINFNGADMGITTRHGAGKITFYTGNAVTQQLILPTASVTAGGALCINSSRVLTKCTSAVDASGNCTCP